MKWEDKQLKEGQRRTRKRFAWTPHRIHDSYVVVWLECYKQVQEVERITKTHYSRAGQSRRYTVLEYRTIREEAKK